MKEIDKRIFEYFRIAGKGGHYEITVPFLDTYLQMKYNEQEYIGRKLLEHLTDLIKEKYIQNTTGSKVMLTQKGLGLLDS